MENDDDKKAPSKGASMDLGVVSPDIHAFYIESECLLLSEARQEIHLLNTSASFIFFFLQERKTSLEIMAELQKTFNLSEAMAAELVRSAVTEWRAKGFIQCHESRANVT
jgi:hypothetical protein